jgi:hypothetical protein
MVSRSNPVPLIEGIFEVMVLQLKVEVRVLFLHRIVLLEEPPIRCSRNIQSSLSLLVLEKPKARWEYE